MIELEITSIRAQNSGEEIFVFISISNGDNIQKESFLISSEDYVKLSLKKGAISKEEYDLISHTSAVYLATKKAFSVLSYGSTSEKRLYLKLISKGVEKEIASEAVRRVLASGLLDQRADAIRDAERGYSKLWGIKRIISALYDKGYPKECVDAAMESLVEGGADFAENCSLLIKKRYGEIPDDRSELRKMLGALMRYGYSSADIKEAIDILKNDR